MAFTGNAQLGAHAALAIGNHAIVGIVSFIQSGKTNHVADISGLQSTTKEFVSTHLLSPGKFEVTYNRHAADAGQAAVKAAFDGMTKNSYTITLPKAVGQTTRGDVYSFSALVEELDDCSMVSPSRPIVTKAVLRVSGTVSFTAGA